MAYNSMTTVQDFLANDMKFKNSYFWTPPSSASSRRAMEFDDSIMVEVNGNAYELKQSISCSCKNVYYSKSIVKNGKVTNLTALKNDMKKAGLV